MSIGCDTCGTNLGDCPDCAKAQLEIEELRDTVKDLEKERDDLLDKVEQYRDILQGYAIEMQAELRRLR